MNAVPEQNTPQHVAIIMDGNGRWAQRQGLPRIEGHRAGAQAVRRAVEFCSEASIHYLTLYAFSTENWQRPAGEIRQLMELLRRFIGDHLEDLQKHGIRLNAIGDLERLPIPVRKSLSAAIRQTRTNDAGVLTLALSYGSRREIVRAAVQLAERVQKGELAPEAITEEVFAGYLYTADLPDPDLIIRTSGEFRLSNFLLWQASYAELWVTETYWPDFGAEDFREAIREYARRHRRFGGLKNA